MPAFNEDYISTDPTGSEDANTIDNIIRSLKVALEERLKLEHYSLEVGGQDSGAAGAAGRHRPGATSVLYYGAHVDYQETPLPGAIAYFTDTVPTTGTSGFHVRGVGSWDPIELSASGIQADNETLWIDVALSPPVLAMRHNNQQWTSTQTLLDTATIETDCNDSNSFSLAITANRTLGNPTNIKEGATYFWIITQGGSGTNTLTFGSQFKWMGGIAPLLSSGVGKIDVISCIAVGGDGVDASLLGSVLYDFN